MTVCDQCASKENVGVHFMNSHLNKTSLWPGAVRVFRWLWVRETSPWWCCFWTRIYKKEANLPQLKLCLPRPRLRRLRLHQHRPRRRLNVSSFTTGSNWILCVVASLCNTGTIIAEYCFFSRCSGSKGRDGNKTSDGCQDHSENPLHVQDVQRHLIFRR